MSAPYVDLLNLAVRTRTALTEPDALPAGELESYEDYVEMLDALEGPAAPSPAYLYALDRLDELANALTARIER